LELYLNPKKGLKNDVLIHKQLRKDGYQITLKQVREILSNLAEKQINKAKVKISLFRITSTKGNYQADLMFFDKYKRNNRQYIGILTMIEIITRKGYVCAFKDKKAKTIELCLKEILNMINEPVHSITFDKGTEFNNTKIKEFLKSQKIKIHMAETADKHKMGMIERFNRTIRSKMQKLFIINGNFKWIDYLDDVVQNYNETSHGSLPDGKAPKEMDDMAVSRKVIDDLEHNQETEKQIDLDIGDKVRVKNTDRMFKKEGNYWSEKIFIIEKRKGYRFFVDKKWRSANELMKIGDVIETNQKKKIDKEDYEKKEKQKRILKKEKINLKVLRTKRKRIPKKKDDDFEY